MYVRVVAYQGANSAIEVPVLRRVFWVKNSVGWLCLRVVVKLTCVAAQGVWKTVGSKVRQHDSVLMKVIAVQAITLLHDLRVMFLDSSL